jgi:drug/metabolite transporter (DMT)-like permease
MRFSALALTAAALVCFAGNSISCRLALAGGRIDATTFTAVRLASGAALLYVLSFRRAPTPPRARPWLSAAALFAYAAPFSYAYLWLGAGLGALVLFGSVQMTMLGWAIRGGERPSVAAWLGIGVAVAGLVGLTGFGKGAPDPLGAMLMVVAGVAWGVYSLRGRATAEDPLALTASSFARAAPLAVLLVAVVAPFVPLHASFEGLLLAATSGAVASGLGYSVWYAALRHLSATNAAVVQLFVPVVAAAGGVALLGEKVSARLVLTSVAILGGVALVIRERTTVRRDNPRSA